MVLLSFDIEEFDMPLEYGGEIPLEEQLSVSRAGLISVLALLKKHSAKATFFSTVIFAENNQDLVRQLLAEGHELASHTWYHSDFETAHLAASRLRLEELFRADITGLRMPRMREVDSLDVLKAGYDYNSSINPTFLPGRYNNLHVSRKFFLEKGLMQIPASVSALFRIPLFWLSFHNFPLSFYKKFTAGALRKDGYLNLYFHPWEFADISAPKYKLPGYTIKNSGEKMIARFDDFLGWLNGKNVTFATFQEFFNSKQQ